MPKRYFSATCIFPGVIVGVLSCVGAGAQDAALPEGQTGIAAAYANDVGIEAHANVLFADDFESYSSANQLTSSGNYDVYYHESDVVIDTNTVFAGA